MMTFKRLVLSLGALLCLATIVQTKQLRTQRAEPEVPSFGSSRSPEISGLRLVKFSGVVKDQLGQPLTGVVGITFGIYKDQEGGAPLWLETQNVQLNAQGAYSVLLGSTTGEGIPLDIFSSNEPRWLGIETSVAGSADQPRLLLVSVPYALKAADADTLGGKSISEFVLADSARNKGRYRASADKTESDNSKSPTEDGAAAADATGNAGYLAKFLDSTNLGNSDVFNISSNIGIGTTAPSYPLHVYKSTYTSGSVGSNILLKLQSNASGADSNIQFSDGVVNSAQFGMVGGSYYITSNGIERLRISSSGMVGVGTTLPSYPLHVYKSTYTSPTAGSNILLRLQSNASGADANIQFSDGVANSAQFGMAGGAYYITSNGTEFFRISPSGNVGIGTNTPSTKLHVSGDVTVTGNIAAKYQDVAEWVEASEPLVPGTVVVIEPERHGYVRPSATPYDTTVVGAVSPQPGLILGEKGPNKVMVAQSGRVRIKVDAQYGPIRPGDLLVTSATPGHAMRSQPIFIADTAVHRPGTLLGKALEPLNEGTGEILALLTLQ